MMRRTPLDAHARYMSHDRREQREVDEVWIELRAPPGGDHVKRRFHAAAFPVSSTVRDGVERIGDRDDPRFERNSGPAKATRVPATVPTLVVGENSFGELWIKRFDRSEHVGATTRVSIDLAALRRCELRWLVQDIEQRSVDLPDVVKERDTLDGATRTLVEASGVGNDQRIGSYAPNVHSGLLIVCLDGIEQGLKCRTREALQGAARATLANDQSAEGASGDETDE
jgi:hypothetical protein